MVDKLKTVFNAAIDDELVKNNPLKGVATTINCNEEKQVHVSSELVRAAIEHAPDKEFGAIIALARFGGLRTPSEFRHLKHGDFYKEDGIPVFRIYCQKTAHKGKQNRKAPVFSELQPFLKGVVSTDTVKADDFVFPAKYRECSDANIYNTMKRALKNAGIEPWPDLWRNLRASRESELLQRGGNIKDVCLWLGNTPQVVMKHYLRSDPDALRKATTSEPSNDGTASDSGAGDQIGDQHLPEEGVRTGTKGKLRQELRQRKPLVLHSDTRKATPNTEWLYALERKITDDENTVNTGVSEVPEKTEDLIKDLLPESHADLLALVAQLASLPTETREGLATLLNTIAPYSSGQQKD